MTKKYEIDPYLQECMATVKDTFRDESKAIWVSLDQTVFYPEGGGQPADIGTIDDVAVLDAQMIDNEIFHKVETDIYKQRVKVSIDFQRRFDHMQQHTGQHLLSAVWRELYNIETISFHLGEEYCTIDLLIDELSDEQIDSVEKKVAEYIFENHTVESLIVPVDEVLEREIAHLKAKPQYVRFVKIEQVDESTCCGTHVHSLGEIGVLKILGWERYKKHVRLTFICGGRAISYFQLLHTTMVEVGKKLHAPLVQLDEKFTQYFKKNQLLKKDFQTIYERAIYLEAEKLLHETKGDWVEVTFSDRDVQEMKDLAKAIIQHEGKVVVIQSESLSTWIFASSSSDLFHVSDTIKIVKETCGGSGGGNPVFGQWSGKMTKEQWHLLKNR